MDWIIRVAKGAVIALGFILPGVSGGVLAAVMGLYERIIRFLANVRRRFRTDLPYFIPVGIGGLLGLGLLSKPLVWALENWQVAVLWGFAGAILGTIPMLWRQAASIKARSGIDWALLVGSFVVSFSGFFVLRELHGTVPANFAGFLLAGALMALGVLVPGVSPSNLLLILGLLTPMLNGFALRGGKREGILGVYLPIIIGAVVVLLAFSKLMERLLDRAHSHVYHCMIGLVLASTILIVVPQLREVTAEDESIVYSGVSALQVAAAAGLFVAGLALGLWMSHLEAKVTDRIEA